MIANSVICLFSLAAKFCMVVKKTRFFLYLGKGRLHQTKKDKDTMWMTISQSWCSYTNQKTTKSIQWSQMCSDIPPRHLITYAVPLNCNVALTHMSELQVVEWLLIKEAWHSLRLRAFTTQGKQWILTNITSAMPF